LKNNLQVPFTILKTQLKDKQNVKIILSEDVTFLNKAAFQNTLAAIPDNSKVTLDASNTKFVHHDIMEILENFEISAESRDILICRVGFESVNEKITPQHFEMEFEDPISKEELDQLTPEKALEMLKEGNLRFMENKKLHRDYHTQIDQTSFGQYPFGVILSCIDSRVPVELVFDQGIGDLFSIRVAGNVINGDVIGSMEYGCKVVGSKIIVVMGHTSCGAVNAACSGFELDNITPILEKIKPAIEKVKAHSHGEELNSDHVSIENVKNSISEIRRQSPILAELEKTGQIKIVGANYSVNTGQISFME
jgi:carbonic anhydrase